MALDLDAIRRAVLSLVYEYLGRTGVLFMEFLGNCVIGLLILVIGFKLSNYVVKICKKCLNGPKWT